MLIAAAPGGVTSNVLTKFAEGDVDFRKMTLQEVTVIGTYCYTNKDFKDSIEILTNNRLGSLNWIEYRSLKDGANAFKEIHNGTCVAPKIILIPDNS